MKQIIQAGATYKSRNEDCKILNEAYTLLVDKKKDVGAAYAAMARLYPTRSSAFYIYNERKTLASEGQKLRQDYWGSMDFK